MIKSVLCIRAESEEDLEKIDMLLLESHILDEETKNTIIQLGVKTIWYEQEIDSKWKKKEEILMEPDYKIKSMKELLEIVE